MAIRIPPSLEAAAASLRSRYAGRHSAEVVEACLLEAYERLSRTARVQDFVPIFAERSARARLDSGGDVALTGSPAPPRRRSAPVRRRAAAGSD
jgi:Protein-tyrosine-phosphatase-like, N-terminal domain/Protein of unknown function (DUF3562)